MNDSFLQSQLFELNEKYDKVLNENRLVLNKNRNLSEKLARIEEWQ